MYEWYRYSYINNTPAIEFFVKLFPSFFVIGDNVCISQLLILRFQTFWLTQKHLVSNSYLFFDKASEGILGTLSPTLYHTYGIPSYSTGHKILYSPFLGCQRTFPGVASILRIYLCSQAYLQAVKSTFRNWDISISNFQILYLWWRVFLNSH